MVFDADSDSKSNGERQHTSYIFDCLHLILGISVWLR